MTQITHRKTESLIIPFDLDPDKIWSNNDWNP